MVIIGITGTIGAGKGAIVGYLKEKKFKHYSAREFIIHETKKRGLSVNRDTIVETANDLRLQYGPGYIIESLFNQAVANKSNAIIESIRNLGELEILCIHNNFYLIAIDADQQLRYERIVKRGSETDNVTFEEFLAHEEREMDSDDPTKQNIKAVVKKADFHVENNGTLEDLHKQIDQILHKISSITT